MEIRDARDDDWPGIWAIVTEVLAEGDAYTYDPDMTEDEGRGKWLPPRAVAHHGGGRRRPGPGRRDLGTQPVRPGIAHQQRQLHRGERGTGRGVGTALVEDTLARARAEGYAGMQFNAVVETNPAVALYERFGFEIIGTVPGAFRHPRMARSACT